MRCGSAGLTFFLFLASLGAQTTEIVVTATKEPTSAETLPAGVTVLDGGDWEGRSTVAEVLSQTLAVRLDTAVPGQSVLSAPGFGENGFGRISLLIDGFSQANTEMRAPSLNLVPLFALERIEVLGGPAPGLYGSGAVSGAVNLITKIPRQFEAETTLTLESTLTNRQTLSAALPAGPGGILVSLARQQNLPQRDRSDSDLYQAWAQAALPWTAGAIDQELRVWASVSREALQYPGALLTTDYAADPNRSTKNGDEGSTNESKGFVSWELFGDSWSLTMPGSAVHRSGKALYRSQPAFNSTEYFLGSLAPRARVSLGTSGGDGWELAAGLDLSWSNLTVDRYSDAGLTARIIRAVIDRWTGAGWGRYEVSWSERFLLSGVLRLEAVRTQSGSQESPAVNGNREFFPWSGQAGVVWRPFPGVKFGAEGARVYRYPFTDEMISYYGDSGWGNYDVFLKDLTPESGLSVSFSAGWEAGHWSLAASGTYLAMDDEIGYDSVLSRNRNLGKTTHLIALFQIEQNLDWLAAGAEYTLEDARASQGEHSGKILPLVPGHRGRFWTKVTGGVVAAEGSWTFTGPFFRGGDAANALPAVPWAQNLSAGLTIFLGTRDLNLRVYGANLTDDRTPSSVYYSSFSGNTGWYPSDGRVLGTTLTWSL